MTAFITLLTNESYLPGVLTLGKALKHKYQSTYKLAILVNSDSLSKESAELIESVYDDVIDVGDKLIYSSVDEVDTKLGRPELAVTYSKVLLWSLTQYDTLIYLDADTLPLANLDHLFDEHKDLLLTQVVASPDAGWPDIFNSGVLILKPLTETFTDLVKHIETEETPSFDGADQGLLNEFFNLKTKGSNWKRLPFIYNVTPNASYQYTPAFDRFAGDIKLIHFIGSVKPWNADFLLHGNYQAQASLYDVHKLWWSTFHEHFPGELGAKILKVKGEGYSLKFGKNKNVWDEDADTTVGGATGGTSDEPIAPVFPWEEREKRHPTRTFTPPPYGEEASEEGEQEKLHDELKKSIETLNLKTSSGSKAGSLKDKYNIDLSEDNKWDPTASLNEIAQLPSKLLSKKREEESKK